MRLSARRRKKLARLPVRLDVTRLERLLLAHTASQPWHPELGAAAIDATIAQLVDYRRSQARRLVPVE